MHPRICRLLALLALLFVGTTPAQAQFGRPPMPRLRPGGGPHLPHFHLPGLGDSDIGMYCLIVVGALALIAAGFLVGSSLGRSWRGVPVFPKVTVTAPGAASQAVPSMQNLGSAASVPPMEDLIISPGEVIDKNLWTSRLLMSLAKTQPVFDPEALRQWIRIYFYQVQNCWQQRDLTPVRESMTAQALTRFEDLISAMRRNRQINRVDDLRVRRLEFVHIACAEQQAVTALITFEGRAYFVHETTAAFIQGAQKNTWYQEFWTFQRHGDGWKLHQVQESTDDSHLNAPNRVDGLSEEELQNVERGAIML
jgi:predicted lipid-binding transport protein (Tim44 family)